MPSLTALKKRVTSYSSPAFETLILLVALGFIATADFAYAQEATPTSITLTWTAPGDDSLIGTAHIYDMRYSLLPITEVSWNDAEQVDDEPSPQPPGSPESFTVTGLSPGTEYYFAVKTADEVLNWSPLSNVVLRRTLDEQTPPAVIADLGVIGSTPASISLAWTAPGDDGNSGTAAQYDIRYSNSPITDLNWDTIDQIDGEPPPQAAGSAETFTVSGLTAGETYYFAIKTADEVNNWSGLSNVVSGTTGDEQEPPGVIADLSVSSATPNSITLIWTAPGDDGAGGTATEYDIRYATLPVTVSNWDDAVQVESEPVPQSSGSSESFTVTHLNPGTTYYFAMKTADEVPNWSALSNVASGSTVDNIPPAAINDLAAAWFMLMDALSFAGAEAATLAMTVAEQTLL